MSIEKQQSAELRNAKNDLQLKREKLEGKNKAMERYEREADLLVASYLKFLEVIIWRLAA